ncbi:hypothetical protein MNEG_6353 [Monoraphidium neglectum]|uniref:Right handed beta helix domain-containing protein n=1 Tax=Monoraphidium neglectum TaxID=145388 RepID=A0A0D2JRB8_9CHLO|nr:hypothetical protein MNEG_6353 [Monoraphidium neglectum]KIZ01608.1 hypothetical protein MNEG_6353 [Monoraphidium neglectum]|eukprot:XP_013900627.1 hypothetical protein MNEG_6353 [Monoraphidium neglectum]
MCRSMHVVDGGGLYLYYGDYEYGTVLVANSTFAKNTAGGVGGCLYAEQIHRLALKDCSFTACRSETDGGAVYIANLAATQVQRTRFEGNRAVCFGGGIMQWGRSATVIDGCTFDGNSASEGGGVKIHANALHGLEGGVNITLLNSSFLRNSAANGGGVRLLGGNTTLDACRMEGNRAEIGGSVYYSIECAGSLDGPECKATSSLIIVDPTRIRNNTAAVLGGGVFIAAAHAPVDLRTLAAPVVANNTARVAGADVSIPPVSLLLAGPDGGPLTGVAVSVSRGALDQGLLPPFAAFCSDKAGGGVGGVGLVVKVAAAPPGAQAALLTGATAVTNATGWALFQHAKLRGRPGSYRLAVEAIELRALAAPAMSVALRGCLEGEVAARPRLDACEPCQRNTYALEPGAEACQTCMAGATCYGGSAVVPLPGHWRSSLGSAEVLACPNPSACRGNRSALYSCGPDGVCTGAGGPNAQCSRGYTGPLCGQCAPGYGAVAAPLHCAPCVAAAGARALLILALAALTVTVAYVSAAEWRDNRSGRNAPLPSDYLKLLVGHLQHLAIIYSLPLPWPNTITLPLRVLSSSTAGPGLSMALECALGPGIGADGGGGSGSFNNGGLPAPLQRILVYLLLPAGVFGLALGLQLAWRGVRWQLTLWRSGHACAARPLHVGAWLCDAAPITAVTTAYVLYPTLLRIGLGMFACVAADKRGGASAGRYWVHFMGQRCWEGWHKPWALGVGVSLTAVFVGVLPAALVALLRRHRTAITAGRPAIAARWGFLYHNYCPACVWWEAVAMLQTALLVGVAAIGHVTGPFIAALALSSALMAILMALVLVRPLRFAALQRLQVASHASALLVLQVSISFVDTPGGGGPAAPAVAAWQRAAGAVVMAVSAAVAAVMAIEAVRSAQLGALAARSLRSAASWLSGRTASLQSLLLHGVYTSKQQPPLEPLPTSH